MNMLRTSEESSTDTESLTSSCSLSVLVIQKLSNCFQKDPGNSVGRMGQEPGRKKNVNEQNIQRTKVFSALDGRSVLSSSPSSSLRKALFVLSLSPWFSTNTSDICLAWKALALSKVSHLFSPSPACPCTCGTSEQKQQLYTRQGVHVNRVGGPHSPAEVNIWKT